MKRNGMKRFALWIVFALFFTMPGLAGAGTTGFYPGPGPQPDDPIPVATPKKTPTRKPTPKPTRKPTRRPTRRPTRKPTRKPTPKPKKTPKPTPVPAPEPTPEATSKTSSHTLTVYYRYTDGKQAAATYRNEYQTGESYGVHSPAIEGYGCTKKVVSGTMKNRDVTVVVYYSTGDEIFLEDYNTALGLGDVIINIGDCYE